MSTLQRSGDGVIVLSAESVLIFKYCIACHVPFSRCQLGRSI